MMSQPALSNQQPASLPNSSIEPASAGSSFSPLSILDLVVGSRAEPSAGVAPDLDALSARGASWQSKLAAFVRMSFQPGESVDRSELRRRLSSVIAGVDVLLSRQVNAILHAPPLQKLEASWRGLFYLVDQAHGKDLVKIRVLSVRWEELARDVERAIEFDQTQLFRKVYSDEFGTPGGEPYGLLLGDYELTPHVAPGHPTDDPSVLRGVSQAAAAAFAPFIASASPAWFGVDDFSEMQRPINLARILEQPEYLKWRRFRETEDSRFIGLTVPRVLMRTPYGPADGRVDGFIFREQTDAPTSRRHLWGSAVYAFGAVVVRAFSQTSWLAEIRGVEPGKEEGGVVSGLPVVSFGTDAEGTAVKSSTDLAITDARAKDFSDQGFIPLAHCMGTDQAAFYSAQSVQKPKRYDVEAATTNARISAMLQYILCVSRFAHYIKVIARDRIGSFTRAEEIENELHLWVQRYVTADENASQAVKAIYPLREASVQVREEIGKPGSYRCVMHLRPHFQLEQLAASLKLQTELTGPS
jgi:type VI secretion system ImpC/EvpB family protein